MRHECSIGINMHPSMLAHAKGPEDKARSISAGRTSCRAEQTRLAREGQRTAEGGLGYSRVRGLDCCIRQLHGAMRRSWVVVQRCLYTVVRRASLRGAQQVANDKWINCNQCGT